MRIQSPWRQIARIHREVALAQALAVRVLSPEEQRHRGHRLGEHELAHLVHEAAALLVPRLHRAAERRGTAVRPRRPAAAGSRRRTPCTRPCRRSSRTARCPRPRARTPSGSSPAPAASRSSRSRAARAGRSRAPARPPPSRSRRASPRADAHAGHPASLGQPPQRTQVRVRRGCRRRARSPASREQAADEEVPHHPAGRGEPEHAVARAQVQVQALLQLLEQDAAVAVHDRLRQAGRARGVQHPQRVIEGHLLEARRGSPRRRRVQRSSSSLQLMPAQAAPGAGGLGVEVGQQHRVLDVGSSARIAVERPCGRSPCRRGGSRRPRAAPSARSGRSGRSRCARRTPARRSTRSRRSTRPPETRPASRGCSACRRPRGRPADAERAQAGAAAATCALSSPQVSCVRARAAPRRAAPPPSGPRRARRPAHRACSPRS